MPCSIDAVVVVCPGPEQPEAHLLDTRVAHLPLLTRMLLSAQQAGFRTLTVVASAGQQPALQWQVDADRRLPGNVRWLASEPVGQPRSMYTLVLFPWVILDPRALRSWLARVRGDAPVTAPDQHGMGPAVVQAAHLDSCIRAGLSGPGGLGDFLGEASGNHGLQVVPWEGLRHRLQSADEAPAVERAMIAAMRSPEDGPLVDRFVNRVLSGRLTRWLLPTSLTPNQISLASVVTGFAGAWFLGVDQLLPSLIGLALYQASVILDHVDGEVARLKFLQSPLGKWVDNVGDHAVNLAVIGSLTWRVVARGPATSLLPLGLAAALGVTGAFLTVFWWSVSAQALRRRMTPFARLLARVLAGLANRDGFCLAVWVMVLLNRPTWLLWALACGANLYWIAWILTHGLPRRSRTTPSTS